MWPFPRAASAIPAQTVSTDSGPTTRSAASIVNAMLVGPNCNGASSPCATKTAVNVIAVRAWLDEGNDNG
jgi:hypothetical protein